MARPDDEPDLGEIRGLLRRLEGGDQPGGETQLRRVEAPRADPAPAAASQRWPSSAAVLILIANTVMATATITSIAWYFFHSATIPRSAQQESEPAHQPAVPDAAALSQPAAPPAEPLSASRAAAETSSSERGSTDGVKDAPLVGAQAPATPEEAQKAPAPAAPEIAHEVQSRPPEVSDLTRGSPGSGPRDGITSTGSDLVQEGAAHKSLVQKARGLLAFGQIAAARLLLQRAAEGNDAEGALLLAETFDPAHASFPGLGAEAADKEAARIWYERAAALGSAKAQARVSGVKPN